MIALPRPGRPRRAPVHRRVPPGILLALLLCARWLPSQPPGQDLVLSFAGLLGCCLLFAAAERALARSWRAVGAVVLVGLAMLTLLVAARLFWHGLTLAAGGNEVAAVQGGAVS